MKNLWIGPYIPPSDPNNFKVTPAPWAWPADEVAFVFLPSPHITFSICVKEDVVEKINNIQFAFDKINQDRNIYEVLNNRSKQL